MKKIILLLFVLFFTTSIFSVEKDYNISINVKGIKNDIGILAFYYGDKKLIKDTLKFDSKGIATIKGKKDIARGVYLVAFPSLKFQSFDLILTETSFNISTDTSNFITKATVSGSVENKQLFEDMKFMTPLGIRNDSLQKVARLLQKDDPSYKKIISQIEEIGKIITKQRKDLAKKYPTTFYTKLLKIMQDVDVPDGKRNENGALIDTFHAFHYITQHYFDDIDFSDSGLIRSPVFQGKIIKYFDQFVYPVPDSIIKSIDFLINKTLVNKEMYQFCVNNLFMKYAKSEIMGYDAIYVDMAEKYYINGKAWWADEKGIAELRERTEALKPTLIGKMTPNFTVYDTLNKSHTLYDFIPKNKYTLLVFWNSDCGHCQKEIPALKQMYLDSLKNLGVRVFSVSTEQVDSTFRKFVSNNCATDWINAADMRGMSAFRREYDLVTTPKLFLIKPDYKIVAKNIPLENLTDFIKFQDGLKIKK